MSFTFKIEDAVARKRFSPEAKRKAYAILMPNVRSDTDKYIPYRTGYLSDRSLDPSRFEEGIIAWNAPYAGIVYYMPANCNWTRTRHGMAGPQWMERSSAANKDRWQKIIAASYGGQI